MNKSIFYSSVLKQMGWKFCTFGDQNVFAGRIWAEAPGRKETGMIGTDCGSVLECRCVRACCAADKHQTEPNTRIKIPSRLDENRNLQAAGRGSGIRLHPAEWGVWSVAMRNKITQLCFISMEMDASLQMFSNWSMNDGKFSSSCRFAGEVFLQQNIQPGRTASSALSFGACSSSTAFHCFVSDSSRGGFVSFTVH